MPPAVVVKTPKNSKDEYTLSLYKSEKQFSKKVNRSPARKYDKNDFDFIELIGSGAFSKVYLAVLKETGQQYAIKKLDKPQILRSNRAKRISKEIKILKEIDFPFCVQLKISFNDPPYSYLCLPYLPGGDLYEHLQEQKQFPEEKSKFYAAQVFLALDYIHFLNIVHRDIKPENILLDLNGYIKLTDFGLCKKIDNSRAYTTCGTPEYMAPEIILHKGHGISVDWWSFGILLFELSAGCTPFSDPEIVKMYEKIVAGGYQIPEHFSVELADLIKNLLNVDLSKRYGNLKGGAASIKEHTWFGPIDWTGIFNRSVPAHYIPNPHLKRKNVTPSYKKMTFDINDCLK